MGPSYARKYATGTGADVYIPIVKAGSNNFALSADWTPATGDVKVSKDGAAPDDVGTLPVAVTMGNAAMWKFVFTDAELTAKQILIIVSDAATKAVEDQYFSIETYGNASAMHPFDLGTASTPQTADHTATLSTIAGDVANIDGAAMRGTDGASTHAAADVWTSGSRTLTAFGFSVDLNANQSGVTIGTINALAANSVNASALATDAVEEIADQVWDEVLSGATHNVPSSSGRRLRQLADLVIHSGTAQAGAIDSITLDAGASATDKIYQLNYVTIVAGAGAGQTRIIVAYDGTTKVGIVHRNWDVNPDSSSEFQINANANAQVLHLGTVVASAPTTVTLAADASSDNASYVGTTILLATGTGREQARLITAYNGTTKVATIQTAWGIDPDTTTSYIIWPFGRSLVAGTTAGAITSGSFATDALDANALAADAVTEIQSGLSTHSAADVWTAGTRTLTAFGFSVDLNVDQSGVTIGTVNTLTGHTVQTGDSFARIGVNGAGLSDIPWNANWDAEVQSEVEDGLIAHGLDHLIGTSVLAGDVAENSIISRIVDKGVAATYANYDNTTDSLRAIRDRGDAAWVTATGFMLATENGSSFTAIPWNANWDVEVQSEVKDALDAEGLNAIRTGVAQAGAAGSITLDASASAVTDFYAGCNIYLTSGTGVGQVRTCTAYNASTKVATTTPSWATNPAVSTGFAVVREGSANVAAWRRSVPNVVISGRVDSSVGAMAANVLTVTAVQGSAFTAAKFHADTGIGAVRSAALAGGAPGSVTLDASASSVTDFYAGCIISIVAGTGIGQFRVCTAYDGTTKVATVVPDWATNPAAGATFVVHLRGSANVSSWRRSQPNVLQSGRTDADVGFMRANVLTDTAINTGAVTAAKLAAGAIDAAAVAADAIGASELATDAVNKIRDSILADSTPFNGARIDATVTSRATPVQVNAEVVDVLRVDTPSELVAALPPISPSQHEMIQWLYMQWRNAAQFTATQRDVRNDAGTIVAKATAMTEDGTTFNQDKMASG